MPAVGDNRALLSGSYWYPGAPAARAIVLTYSFAAAPSVAMSTYYPGAVGSFQPFDAEDQAAARRALSYWSAASGVTFLERSQGEGDIVFSHASLSQMGLGSAVGVSTYPDPTATGSYGGYNSADIYIDFAFRNAQRAIFQNVNQSDDDVLLPVLKHELGHALGFKHATEGEFTLDPAQINVLTTVLSYGKAPLHDIGTLDKAAVQLVYGTPAGASSPGTWHWDAASETFSLSNDVPGAFVRGTAAPDVIDVKGEAAAVYTAQGDDIIQAFGQSLTVNAGTGTDVVRAGMVYRPNEGMSVSGLTNSRQLLIGGKTYQSYAEVERIEFVNGVLDGATGTFAFAAPPPASPVAFYMGVDTAGALVVAGTSPGASVPLALSPAFPGVTAGAVVAGTWTATVDLPQLGALSIRTLTAKTQNLGQDSPSVAVASLRIGSDQADPSLTASATQPSVIDGRGGNDTLAGGPLDDILIGGHGTDTAVIASLRSEVRAGVSGDTAILRGPAGTDTLLGVEQVRFSDNTVVALADLADEALMAINRGGVVGFLLPDIYDGPVAHLQHTLLGSSLSEVAGGTLGDDFMNLFGGDDAANGFDGDDVLDGGLGSNFLTGGAGADVFFLDARDGGRTWSTVTDWQQGEQLALWGWEPGLSTLAWRTLDGTPGWQGVTLEADLDANGTPDALVTWTERAQADLPKPVEFPGLLWFL